MRSGELAAPELLALCTEELDLKSAVLDGLADGIVVHTLEGDILYFNPAAAVVYGFAPEEFAKLGRLRMDTARRQATRRRRGSRHSRETGVLDFQSTGLTADGGTDRHRGPRHASSPARISVEVVVSVIQRRHRAAWPRRR